MRRSIIDLIAVSIVVVLTAGVALRTALSSREMSNRIKCAGNLRQIGEAIQIYANSAKGAFPRTTFDRSDDPVPAEYTGVNAADPFLSGGPGPNDVTSGLYLLLRTGHVHSTVFICPSVADATPWAPPPGSTMKSYSNFSSRVNLTYGYCNPYATKAARQLGWKMNYTASGDFAIAADMGSEPGVGAVAYDAPREKMMTANSPNHRGDGQNVLYADVHVDWSPTIFAGAPRPNTSVARDNIYAFGVDANRSTPSTGVHGAAQDQYDSVILPTAETGFQPGPLPAPGSAAAGMNRFMAIGVAGIGLLLLISIGVVVLLLVVRKRPAPAAPPPLPARMPPPPLP